MGCGPFEDVYGRGEVVAETLDLLGQGRVGLGRGELFLGLAGLLAQLIDGRTQLLDLLVGQLERIHDLGLGQLARRGLDHDDGVLVTGDDQVQIGLGALGGIAGQHH